jgi:hypothetical protein
MGRAPQHPLCCRGHGDDMTWAILRGAFLRRDAYVRMVLAPNGAADGLMIVAGVYLLRILVAVFQDVGVVAALRFAVGGVIGWIILSGLVYLIGRHLLEGYGSFPGVLAAASLGFPPLLLAIPLTLVISPLGADLVVSAWLVACLWVAARVALELEPEKAIVAAAGGWACWIVVMYLFHF